MDVNLWAAGDRVLNYEGMVGDPEAQTVRKAIISDSLGEF
jgi:hypothetical protein